MKPTTSLYIIRHGETDLNRAGIIQGRGVNPGLNEKGRQQAALFYEKFGRLPFDHLLVSSLKRTHETVEPFTRSGLIPDIFPHLDEISWGKYEGKPSTPGLRARFQRLLSDWRKGKLEARMPGGESALELQERQLLFFNQTLSRLEGNILIATHGRAMRSLLCLLSGKPLAQMDSFTHQNLSLYKLVKQENQFQIEIFNHIGYEHTEA